MHPLLRLIVSRPQLLADHAQAYADLAAAEFAAASVLWRRHDGSHRLAADALRAPGTLA